MNLSQFPRVTCIMRGYSLSEISTVAQVLLESDNTYALEVPLVSQRTPELIMELTQTFPQLMIGAGTVLTMDDLQHVHRAGATFVLSPVAMTLEMLSYCEAHNILSILGALTPTEIYQAAHLGASIIKVFPINAFRSDYLESLKAPLPSLKVMAVGGVNLTNARNYLKNGADYLGIGSGVFARDSIRDKNRNELAACLVKFEDEIAGFS